MSSDVSRSQTQQQCVLTIDDALGGGVRRDIIITMRQKVKTKFTKMTSILTAVIDGNVAEG